MGTGVQFDTDVCIIGSGFAGLAVATRLTLHGIRTTVVEAGSGAYDPLRPAGDAHLLPASATGDADFGIDDNRCIAVGGASHRWNGVCTRLQEADIDGRWPISYAELSPYLDQAEAWLHVHGDAAREGDEPARTARFVAPLLPTGLLQLTTLDRDGYVRVPMSVRNGGPVRLVDDELQSLRAHAHFRLLSGVTATRVELDGTHGAQVHCRGDGDGDGDRVVVAARHVVVAAGAVDSVRLLLASSSDEHPQGLGNDAGQLGAGINAHPRVRRTIQRDPAFAGDWALVRTYRPAATTRSRGLNAVVVDVNFLGPDPTVDAIAEQRPLDANRIELDASVRDPWGNPGVRVHSMLGDADRQTLAAASELALAQAGRLPGGQHPSAEALRWFHPAGGCRMSSDPSQGVVDEHLAVHGCPSVHVVGASTFPVSGAANPTITVVALAFRLADRLLASETTG